GTDPDRIEDTWQLLQRATYWRGGRAVAAAIAAIDVALWDLKGKRYSAPLYSLLGGKCREGVLCYGHASGRTIEETVEHVLAYRERGCKAIRAQVGTPGYEDGSYGVHASQPITDPARTVRHWEPTPYLRVVPRLFDRLRREVNDSVELLHDVHDRLTPIQVAQLAKELEPYHLFFLEDPIPVENTDGLRLIRQHTTTPIAIGERFNSKWDCLPLLTNQLIDYVRNPLSKSGGLTELRKIAVLAEPFQVKTAFQGPNDLGPLAFAATVHLDLAIPNFGIQELAEYPPEVEELFSGIPTFKDGYLTVSDKPGLGVEINETELRKYPYQPSFFTTIRREDGSLQDP
ncbi:MAG TPA: enolase C-terminal domain-like protein, partial [Thermomicrobiaceae bacterium]|nr:enolase C-terminal domain-like protein [Thermomicrobiaceae bacterium]